MTKKLAELFNLPEAITEESNIEQTKEILEQNQQTFEEIDSAIDKIDKALPLVKGLDASDTEMDELADLAKSKFEDLMDLGMNVEARFSGQIFQTAGVLLGHAITAKQAKLDKKLRMVDLQLKKMRLDQQAQKNSEELPPSLEGEGVVIDRNTLLAQILNKSK